VRDVRLRRALRAALWRTRYPRIWRFARRFGHALTRG
jgi:hypothetical protein